MLSVERHEFGRSDGPCQLEEVGIEVGPESCRPANSGLNSENWHIKRLSCARGIEIFAEESDLPAPGSKKQHIVLPVNPLCRLDESLCLDFGDGRFRIGEGMHAEIEKTEILHRTNKAKELVDAAVADEPSPAGAIMMRKKRIKRSKSYRSAFLAFFA